MASLELLQNRNIAVGISQSRRFVWNDASAYGNIKRESCLGFLGGMKLGKD